MSDDLEPIGPEQAVEMYIEGRRDELSDQTLPSHVYRLEAFTQWCAEEGIDNLNEITGRDLYAYRVWRREGNGEDREEVTTITLRGQLATLRAFLRLCADIDAVPEDLFSKVPLPTVSASEGVSDTTLEPDRAVEILDYLQRYEYASRKHVTLLLLWHTGRVREVFGGSISATVSSKASRPVCSSSIGPRPTHRSRKARRRAVEQYQRSRRRRPPGLRRRTAR